MSPEQQVNAVALAMQSLMTAIDGAVTRMIGTDQHSIVLVIGCANVSQYSSNTTRENGVGTLKGLLERWQVGLDDVLPGGVEPGSTEAFEYLLRQVEQAVRAPNPSSLDYANRRIELINYVGRLEAKVKRAEQATGGH